MKTQEEIKEEIKILNKMMSKIETVLWFQAKVNQQDWETWRNIPIDEAKTMIAYCIANRTDFSVEFEHEED